MKTDGAIRLFQLQILTLSLGTYLSLGSLDQALVYVVVYILAYYFLHQAKIGENFFISSEKNRFSKPQTEVLFKGQLLPGYDIQDQQEDRFLSHFELSRVAKRRILTACFLALSGFLVFLQAQMEISLTTVMPLICGFFIVSSVYVGHLLVPLGLSVWSVVSHHHPELHVGFYGAFSLFCFWNLQMMSEASGKQVKLKNPYVLIPMTLVFLGIVYGTTFFLPEKKEEQDLTQAPGQFNPAREALEVSKAKATSMAESLKSLPQTGEQDLAEKIQKNLRDIQSAEKILASSKLLNQNPEAARQLMENILDQSQELDLEFKELKVDSLKDVPGSAGKLLEKLVTQTGSNLPELLSELNGKLEQNQSELSHARRELGDKEITEADREKTIQTIDSLSRSGEKLKSELQDLKGLGVDEKESIENYVESKKAEIEKLRAFSKDSEALDSQVKNLEKLRELTNIPKPTPTDLQSLGKALAKTKELEEFKKAAVEAPAAQPRAQAPPSREEITKPFTKPEFSFKKFLPLVVIILIVLLFQYFMRKKGVKKIETLDPEVLKELNREWKKLKKLSLSPKDEVIHFYNLFHDAVQKVHYVAHETPPSCIVFDDLKEVNPKLEKSVFVVTELYTRCFYGNKEVTEKALKTFRKGILNIMRVYGIA